MINDVRKSEASVSPWQIPEPTFASWKCSPAMVAMFCYMLWLIKQSGKGAEILLTFNDWLCRELRKSLSRWEGNRISATWQPIVESVEIKLFSTVRISSCVLYSKEDKFSMMKRRKLTSSYVLIKRSNSVYWEKCTPVMFSSYLASRRASWPLEESQFLWPFFRGPASTIGRVQLKV